MLFRSDRELEIFNLMGQELTARQIAARLNISIKTVEAHRDHIKSKMGIQSSSDVSSYAKEWLQGRSG